MHITIIGVATLLCMLYLAGCANNNDVWVKQSEMIERPVNDQQETANMNMDQEKYSAKSMSAKPMNEESSSE
jgi:outer membrane murein-binding lipoprotein Lpp